MSQSQAEMTYPSRESQKKQIEDLIRGGSIHPDNPLLMEINRKYRELCTI